MVGQGPGPQSCGHMISPGLLHRCSVYCRNEGHKPEICWDSQLMATLLENPNPARTQMSCPNNTLDRRPQDVPSYPIHHRAVPVRVEDSSDEDDKAPELEEVEYA